MADYIQIKNGSTDVDPKNVFYEETTVSIGANQDYFYISPKTGYHLVAVMITEFNGVEDIVIGLSWTATRYAGFLKSAKSTARTNVPISCVWVKT